jgi:hypothetical protein
MVPKARILPSTLLNEERLNDREQDNYRCHVLEKDEVKNEDAIFVPPVSCRKIRPFLIIPLHSGRFLICGEFKTPNSANIPEYGRQLSLPRASDLVVRHWRQQVLAYGISDKRHPKAPRDPSTTGRMKDRETEPVDGQKCHWG